MTKQWVWNSEKEEFELIEVKEGVLKEVERLFDKETADKLRKALEDEEEEEE